MKKLLFLSLSALCLSSCSSKTETPLEIYLNEHNQNLKSLEIIEVSEIDSAYSPYKELMSLSYMYSKLGADIAKLNAKAFKAKSNKEAIAILDSALNIYNQEDAKLDPITNKCFKSIDFPELIDEKNRIYIKAKYKIDGKTQEHNFYFNEDGKTIGHTEEDIRQSANDVLSGLNSTHDAKREIEKDKRAIKRGEYRFNAQ